MGYRYDLHSNACARYRLRTDWMSLDRDLLGQEWDGEPEIPGMEKMLLRF